MNRVRLIDTAWFKQIPPFLEQHRVLSVEKLVYASEFTSALREVEVDGARVGSDGLLADILRLHTLDVRRSHERWCKYGFRHDRGNKRMRPRIKAGHFGGVVHAAAQQFDLEVTKPHPDYKPVDPKLHPGYAVHRLAFFLDDVARLVDRVSHQLDRPLYRDDLRAAYESPPDYFWTEHEVAPEADLVTADTLTNDALDLSLKTLWTLSHVEIEGYAKTRHKRAWQYELDYKAIYDELDSDAIISIACEMPILFDVLKTRDEIEASFKFALDLMVPPSNERDTDGTIAGYLPTQKLRIALATWCSAVQAWDKLAANFDS